MASAISVILPTHNRAHLLTRAISSVLQQLEDGDELIVVDDGSTDDTKSVVTGFGRRIQYIGTAGSGAGAARNIGVQNARNPLVAFIDSDDEWLPGKTRIQREFMDAKPDVLFCFSNFSFREIDELGGAFKRFNLATWSRDTRSWDEILAPGQKINSLVSLPQGIDDFNYHLGSMCAAELSANYINVNTLVVRRQEAGNALHFAEDTPTYEDWECFGRLACAGQAAYLDLETACQHSHGGSRLTDAHSTECALARVTILPRVWGSNNEFLQEHKELYQTVIDHERLVLIDGLLVRGETSKARKELLQMSGRTSLVRHLLATLPGNMTKMLLAVRRALRP
jgi:hypothetical protein